MDKILPKRPQSGLYRRFADHYEPFMYESSGPEGAVWIIGDDGSTPRNLPRKGEIWAGFGKPKPKTVAEAKKLGFERIDLSEMVETLFPEQVKECKRRQKARDDAEAMVKKAFGVVEILWGGDSMPKTQQRARDAGLNIAAMYGRCLTNSHIGDNQYAHYLVTGVGIDDYEDAFIVTKGKRDESDLVAYINASRRIRLVLKHCDYNLKKKFFRCWECGCGKYSFWDIKVDSYSSLSAARALEQRIDFALDRYCGC